MTVVVYNNILNDKMTPIQLFGILKTPFNFFAFSKTQYNFFDVHPPSILLNVIAQAS